MRFLLRSLFAILLLLVVVIITVPAALVVGLNSKAGRNFLVEQVNQRSGGMLNVAGLAGHFPADLKLSSITVADKHGVWLTGSNLELRWQPSALFSRRLHVTLLTADTLAVARAPVANATKKKSSGEINLYHFRAVVDHVAIPKLGLGAALTGRDLTFAVSGNAHVESLTQGGADLSALAANHQGSYQLAAAIDNQNVNTVLHLSEPPDGLLGHYAGPQVHEPLTLEMALIGPRDNAALNFAAALGAARLNGAGMLGLDPKAPKADVTLIVPSLAPVGVLAGKNLGGSTKLHLVASQKDNIANIALDGDVALNAGPGPAAKLVGPYGKLALRLSLAHNVADIHSLSITGAGFDITATGQVAQAGLNLKTHLDLNDVAAVSHGISGSVTDDNIIIGTPKDFAVDAIISGTIKQKKIPSGPFSITLAVQHLPRTPEGTIKGSGSLENAPLSIDAAFARVASGAASAHIASASWASTNLQADLALAAGAKLPTGTAKIVIRRLADFAPFSPVPISGSVNADFAHRDAQNFTLNVTATDVNVSPSLGTIDAKLNADGPLTNLGVKLNATLTKLINAPLIVAASGAINADTQTLSLRSLAAGWKSLNVNLRGPAVIKTKPDIVVQHLALNVNGGSVALDGRLTPSLNVTLNATNLPASLAEIASPNLKVSGTLSATAKITGTKTAPAGDITLNAEAIKLHSGPGEALPPANLTASAKLSGRSANVNARFDAGPDANLEANGLVPLSQTGPMNVKLAGMTDLQLLDPILAARGTALRGILTPDFTLTGTPAAPIANGTLSLERGSVENVGTGLNLTAMSAHVDAAGRLVTLRDFTATAGAGSITGHGYINLGEPSFPLDFVINADNATPVSSDLLTENFDAALTLKGAVKAAMTFGGNIEIHRATINIPKSLPPSVARLRIYRPGEKPPPPPAPAPDIALNLLIHAHNQIFIRGDGLFAELGGRLTLQGTAADPIPEGGFTLIRGTFALGGKTLQFTQGLVSFNGAGFMPTLDLEATTTTNNNNTATLIIGGTAADPTITLTSSPPLPSDEVLSQLLFGQSTQNLSPFQAASLAAALASLSGIGGSAVSDPLGGVRNALGLDQLSLGGGQNGGAPSLQAGRYVAPGVYVGAQQSTSGSGTQVTVQVDLYKGLKLQTETGTSSSGSGQASSVGLTYQFNY